MGTLIIYGLTMGMVLFLLSVGLTMIFGMLDVINFSHGSFYMLGAYIGYSILRIVGNYWIALAITPFIVGFIGAGMELTTLRHLYKRSALYQVLLTFGFILVFEDLIKIFWGTYQLSFTTPKILSGTITLFDILIPIYRIFVVIFVAFITGGLSILMKKTKVGILIRASSSNRKMVQSLGIDVKKVFTGTFALGTGLAGLSGIIAALIVPVTPGMGVVIIIDCFIVVVLGGLGSLKGAFLSALLIGEAQAFGAYYLPDYAAFPIYIVMGIVLVIKPQGLFGEARIHR